MSLLAARWAAIPLLLAAAAAAHGPARWQPDVAADSQCLIQVQLQASSFRGTEGEGSLGADAALSIRPGASGLLKKLSIVGNAHAALAAVPEARWEALSPADSLQLDIGITRVQEQLLDLLLLLPSDALEQAVGQASHSTRPADVVSASRGTQSWVVPAEQCRATLGAHGPVGISAPCTRPEPARAPPAGGLQGGTDWRSGHDLLKSALAKRRWDEQLKAKRGSRGTPGGDGPGGPGGGKNATAKERQAQEAEQATDAGDVDPFGDPEEDQMFQVKAPPARQHWLFLVNLALVLVAFVIIVLVIVFISPIRGAEGVVRTEDGNVTVQGRSSNKFIQVCLPFWLPVDRNTQGWLWLYLFASACVTSLSLGWLWTMAMARLAFACYPPMLAEFEGTSFKVSAFRSPKIVLLCALGCMAMPLSYLIFYQKLKGRLTQWLFLVWQLTLMFQGTFTGFMGTFIERTVMNWLVERQPDMFWHWQRTFTVITTALQLVTTMMTMYVGVKLNWMWTRYMTRYVLDRYLAKRAYYHLNSNANKEDGADNPDARICDDVPGMIGEISAFVFSMLGLIQGLITSLLIIWATIPYWSMFAVVYCMLGACVSMWFSWVFLRLNYETEKKDADFRFSLFNVRTAAEPIALFAGERNEKKKINNRFEAVQELNMRSIWWNVGFGVFETAYGLGLSMAPKILLYRRYFRGTIDFGGIGQIVEAFDAFTGNLNYLHNNTQSLASLGNCVTRLAGLLSRIEEIDEHSTMSVSHSDLAELDLRDVTICTPSGGAAGPRTLVAGLSFKVGVGSEVRRLLICGRSGVGKSSLLRSIAGLWLNGQGKITRPSDKDCMFLPQQPYMPIGSLRDQLRYPDTQEQEFIDHLWEWSGKEAPTDAELNEKNRAKDQELLKLLSLLGLQDLPSRFPQGFDHNEDWKRFLSTGEQQRVAAVRCMLRCPKLAILDESTSALSQYDETLVYRAIKDTGICYISVGHRPSLAHFHDMVLLINSSTDHRLMTPDEFLLHQQELLQQLDEGDAPDGENDASPKCPPK